MKLCKIHLWSLWSIKCRSEKRKFQGSVCKVVSIQTARTKFPALLCSSLSEFVPFSMPNFGTKPQLVVSLVAEEFVYQKFSKASRGWKSNPVVDSLSQSFSLAKKNSFPTFFPGHTHKIFCPFFNWVPIWWGKVDSRLFAFLPGTVVGECVRYSMHAAPVPWPIKVTRWGSPPNWTIFSWTHWRTAIWSMIP